MSRLWSDDEPIDVQPVSGAVPAAGICPTAFVWRGRLHPVERIHEDWQDDTDWWEEEGDVSRQYFKLTTSTNLLCEVYLDLITETWFMSRVYD